MAASRIMGLALALALGLSGGNAFAQSDAQKNEARKYSNQATAKYRIGEFKKAIELYKKAYEIFPASILLYNIAQSYRQDGNCKRAVFFYRQYISVEPNSPNRSQVDDHITKQEAICARGGGTTGTGTTGTGTTGTGTTGTGTTGTGTTGTGTTGTGTTGTGTTGTGTTGTGTTGTGTTGTGQNIKGSGGGDAQIGASSGGADPGASLTDEAPAPSLLVATAQIGTSRVSMGDLDAPWRTSIALGVAYPLSLGPVGLEPGALVTVASLPWEAPAGATGTSNLIGLLANVGVTYALPADITLRGDLGVGWMVFTGIVDDAAPLFLEMGKVADGAQGMLNVRVGIGAEYEILSGLAATIGFAFATSPAKDGFREDISAINQAQIMLGATYRM